MKDTSKTKNTPVESGADNPTSAAYNLSRRQLLAAGWVTREEKTVLFNTGTGLKYIHLFNKS